MQFISVHSDEFKRYGHVLTGYDVAPLLDAMEKIELPAEGVAYEPGIDSLEYHRGCELNIGTSKFVLLLAKMDDIVDGKLDTSKVKAFVADKGDVVVVYEDTLHYAPCNADGESNFRVCVVLPKNTNTDKPALKAGNEEDKLLWARNKWLIAHADASEAAAGAYVGLVGKNIDIAVD